MLCFHLIYMRFNCFHWFNPKIILNYSKLCSSFKYSIFVKACNDLNKYHLLLSRTYNYIYRTDSSPSLSFPVMHKVLSSYNIFINPDFILKISGMSIAYIFNKQSIVIKVITFGKHNNESIYSIFCHLISDPSSVLW